MLDICIITPVLNAADDIDETVWSVLTQRTNARIRYHVQDGGSTDATLEKLRDWQDRVERDQGFLPAEIRFSFSSEKTGHLHQAFAKSLAGLAPHPQALISRLDAGETFLPGALASVAAVREAHPAIHWIIGETWEKDAAGRLIPASGEPPLLVPREILAAGIADGVFWPCPPHSGVFYSGELLRQSGAIHDEDAGAYPHSADWRLWRAFAALAAPVFLQAPLVAVRGRGVVPSCLQGTVREEINEQLPLEKRAIRCAGIEKAGGETFTALICRPDCAAQWETGEVSFEKNHVRRVPQEPPARYLPHKSARSRKRASLFAPPVDFNGFTYARDSHMRMLAENYLVAANGFPFDIHHCDLKAVQDGLCCAFIDQTLPPGSRILEAGGGNSRVLPLFQAEHECWNIDKFEGCGNGPRTPPKDGYRIVRDYMGNHNPELPEKYFDLVFSISALEHVPDDPETHARILNDIDRVLKPGGWSVHHLDIVLQGDGKYWMHPFTRRLFAHAYALNAFMAPDDAPWRDDLYIMNEHAYNSAWKRITGKAYAAFGQPASIAVFWRKPVS